ncbi:MAG: HAD-IIB family hydrolase [Gemmatimonadales bacterium]
MRPLSEFSKSERGNVQGVFLDIDDTLTSDGKLTAGAYVAMERLHDAEILVVPITGRPAGWCDHIARMWPVDGVVGENGAFYFRYDWSRRTMQKRYLASAEERRRMRAKLESLRDTILGEVPGSALASDQLYRETDLAIDYCEDVERLPPVAVQRIVDLFREAGATAKVSSVHVNGWFGDYDKLGMTKRLMRECFGIDLDADKARFVFVGDSPNDAPMFSYFPHSIGVANVRNFRDTLQAEPTYVAEETRGRGFAEVVDSLLAAR